MKITKSLEEAYRNTLYCAQGMTLRIGEKHPAMDVFLHKHEEICWCFITAFNPFSQEYPLEENLIRNRELKDRLHEQGFVKIFDGEGRGISGDWPPESSFLVLGLSRLEAKAMGKHFKQNAIVWGKIAQEAELVFLV